MRRVAIGSSAEHGSSMQDHVGLDGERAGDAEPLLLAAGEAERALLEPVLDLVPERGLRAAPARRARRASLLHAERCAARTRRCRRSTSGTGSASGTPCRCAAAPRRGRPRARRGRGRGRGPRPSTCAPGIRSFIRFRQRRNVVLPQPDGPMNAVTAFSCTSSVASLEARARRRSAPRGRRCEDRLRRANVARAARELCDSPAVDRGGRGRLVHHGQGRRFVASGHGPSLPSAQRGAWRGW